MTTNRRLVVTENMTIDGVIDATEGWFAPASADSADSSELVTTLRQHMKAQDALVLGRVTFESFREYWPKQTDDTTGITKHLNDVQKYEVSSTLEDPQWEKQRCRQWGSRRGGASAQGPAGGEIGVTGSISIVWQLIDAGLVDEYRLFVYPTIIGHGRRLFESERSRPNVELVEAKTFRSSVVLLTYRAV